MIDNVIKKYRQNLINKSNIGSLSVQMPNIKLPSIGLYSKVTQNKIEKLCKRFCKNAKIELVFISVNCVRHLRTKILIQAFPFQRLIINLFVLAVIWLCWLNARYVG